MTGSAQAWVAQGAQRGYPVKRNLGYLLPLLRIRGCTWYEIIKQWLARPRLAVVGAYDTSNIGDLAMGWTIRKLARDLGISAGMQSFSRLKCFPPTKATILGGGACGTAPRIRELKMHCLNGGASVGIVGIDFSADLPNFRADVLEFLGQTPFLSVRSRCDESRLVSLFSHARAQPDISFALPTAFGLEGPQRRRTKLLGINITPVFLKLQGSAFVADLHLYSLLREHAPEIAHALPTLGFAYLWTVREIVRIYRSRGWQVCCVPFAREDDLIARKLLSSEGVRFARYSADPIRVFRQVAECSRFIATRFHSHVFALLGQVPVLSIAYAQKCASLWQQLPLPAYAQVDRLDLVRDERATVSKLTNAVPVTLGDRQVSSLADEAASEVRLAIKMVCHGCWPCHGRRSS